LGIEIDLIYAVEEEVSLDEIKHLAEDISKVRSSIKDDIYYLIYRKEGNKLILEEKIVYDQLTKEHLKKPMIKIHNIGLCKRVYLFNIKPEELMK